ncbi:MAG: hypothetical protein H6907_04270 [Hyphomicrobiales bacterium]|nr:hypothetical protein [Hyphomicrobiales bacterium]
MAIRTRALARARVLVLAAVLPLAGGACSYSYDSIDDYYGRLKASPPDAAHTRVCHGFSCYYQTAVDNTLILDVLREVMGAADTADQERESIRLAIARVEQVVGPLAGTSNDEGGLRRIRGWGEADQQDCIDETVNTTSYLLMAERNGLLRYHRVRAPVIRGSLLDFRWPHNTAVIEELATSTLWAVDSWVRDNGQPPQVITLAQWMSVW